MKRQALRIYVRRIMLTWALPLAVLAFLNCRKEPTCTTSASPLPEDVFIDDRGALLRCDPFGSRDGGVGDGGAPDSLPDGGEYLRCVAYDAPPNCKLAGSAGAPVLVCTICPPVMACKD